MSAIYRTLHSLFRWLETKITLHQQLWTIVFKKNRCFRIRSLFTVKQTADSTKVWWKYLLIWHLLILTSNVTSYTIPFHTLGTVSFKLSPVRDSPIDPASSTTPGLDSCVLTSRFWAESIWPDATAVTFRHSRIQAGLGPLRNTTDLTQFHFYIYCTVH